MGQVVFPKAPVFTNDFADATYNYIKVTSGDSVTAGSKAQNILELLDDIVQKGREMDISDSENLYVSCTPKLKRLFVEHCLL